MELVERSDGIVRVGVGETFGGCFNWSVVPCIRSVSDFGCVGGWVLL